MKKLLILPFILMTIFSAAAQSSAVDRYYEDFREDDRFTLITVSSKMFSLFVNFERNDPAEQQLINTISKLKGLKMLVGRDIADSKSVFKSVADKPKGKMDELMAITETDKEFKFYVTESDGMISELLMVGYEANQVLILSLVGNIDLKEIAALSRKMDIKGFEHFENVGQ